jgi:hypothetical protein
MVRQSPTMERLRLLPLCKQLVTALAEDASRYAMLTIRLIQPMPHRRECCSIVASCCINTSSAAMRALSHNCIHPQVHASTTAAHLHMLSRFGHHHSEGQRVRGGAAGDASATAAQGPSQAATPQVEQLEAECWGCAHHMKRGSYSCQACHRIQPLDDSLNYFELLGMCVWVRVGWSGCGKH